MTWLTLGFWYGPQKAAIIGSRPAAARASITAATEHIPPSGHGLRRGQYWLSGFSKEMFPFIFTYKWSQFFPANGKRKGSFTPQPFEYHGPSAAASSSIWPPDNRFDLARVSTRYDPSAFGEKRTVLPWRSNNSAGRSTK